jgi:preprotein translocase subunit SecE
VAGRRNSAQARDNHPATEEGEVAKRNRRGEQPADDDNLELFDDAVEEEDDDADRPVSRSGGTAIRTRPKAEAQDQTAKAKKERTNVFARFFGRIGRFIREVVAELRKVIWPTRKELLTYTAVVIVFLVIMVAVVVGLDYVFAKGALLVFGNPE